MGGYQLTKEGDVYAGEKEGVPRVMACAYSTDRFAKLLLQYFNLLPCIVHQELLLIRKYGSTFYVGISQV